MPTQPSDYTDTVLELTLNDARTLRPFAEAVMLAVAPDVQSELDKVNAVLRDAGLTYPTGARGVRDLLAQHEGIIEDLRAEIAELKSRLPEGT